MEKRRALTLDEMHHVQLEGLKKLKSVCEEHDLTYFLAAGTLLGAARHQGFIPWDDDTDVSMPWPDYKKLLKIWPRYIDDDWEFRHYQNMERFFLRHADLCSRHVTDWEKNGRKYNRPIAGCGVDIFPLFFSEDIELIKNVTDIFRKKQSLAIRGEIQPEELMIVHRWAEMKMEAAWSDSGDAYVTALGKTICRKKQFIQDGAKNQYLIFENECFRVPIDYSGCLRSHYGDDYLTPIDYQREHGECYWK